VLRSTRAIARADVCVLVLDAGELVTEQDAHIAGAILEAKRACVVVVNKWDLVDVGPKAGDEYRRLIAESLKHLAWAPVLLASAKSGRNTARILDLARTAYRAYSLSIPTPELNAFFHRAVRGYKPPTLRGRKISLGYIAQEGTRPPSFVVLVNEASRVHFTYRRYLENRLREEFDLGGTAVVLHFRSKAGSAASGAGGDPARPTGGTRQEIQRQQARLTLRKAEARQDNSREEATRFWQAGAGENRGGAGPARASLRRAELASRVVGAESRSTLRHRISNHQGGRPYAGEEIRVHPHRVREPPRSAGGGAAACDQHEANDACSTSS